MRHRQTRHDGTRTFYLLEDDGEPGPEYEAGIPRKPAISAARDLDPAGSYEELLEDPEKYTDELAFLEDGTEKVHVYEAQAWETRAPADRPGWMDETMVDVEVSKTGIQHIDTYMDEDGDGWLSDLVGL